MSSHSWPGRLKSSMYSPAPRMKRGSSLRFTEWPMPPTSGVVCGSVMPAGRCSISVAIAVLLAALCLGCRWLGGRLGGRRCVRLRRQIAGGLLDRLDDVHVAGAAAEVAADSLAD